ncbi:MAG: hypothetical protein Q8942_12065, partial [Bacillota bacterium]|nr:hypothetical protein [Bacillota bacterium]
MFLSIEETLKQVEQIAREVIAINNDEFEPWHILIKIYFKQSAWRKLLDVSEKALELLPQDWNSDVIILDQVKALIETGELSKAE